MRSPRLPARAAAGPAEWPCCGKPSFFLSPPDTLRTGQTLPVPVSPLGLLASVRDVQHKSVQRLSGRDSCGRACSRRQISDQNCAITRFDDFTVVFSIFFLFSFCFSLLTYDWLLDGSRGDGPSAFISAGSICVPGLG